MLHTRKLAEITVSLRNSLQPLEDRQVLGIGIDALSKDFERLGVRVDLSKSAARLRRRLYAMWRSPLVLHELVTLGPEGFGPRLQYVEPNEVGEIVVDHFKLVHGVRMLPAKSGRTVDGVLAAEVLQKVLEGIAHGMKSGPRDLPANTGALLWALHANESARRVKKQGLAPAIARQLKQWGHGDPSPESVELQLDDVAKAGFIQEDEDKFWRLADQLRWGF